jgi:hypothetical protein
MGAETNRREHEVPEAVPEEHSPRALAETLKRAAAALREAGIPFLLCGSMACWARGGPPLVTNDVDFCVKAEDAERALAALAEAGMPTERPPEADCSRRGTAMSSSIFSSARHECRSPTRFSHAVRS